LFSIDFPIIQNKHMLAPTTIVFTGFWANSVILDPIYATEKIMTDFPSNTAKINCCELIFDSPATTFITDDGENGKQSKRNNGPNPCLSTQVVTFFTWLFSLIFTNTFLFPKPRIIKKTRTDPTLAPIHEYK